MIVEQRDYHVFTGKLRELVQLYDTEGIALQQEHLGRLRRRVHDRRRGAFDLHEHVGVQEVTRIASSGATGSRRTSAGSPSSGRSSR